MPFTPFHFGPGVAIKAVIPHYFSFSVFCFAQVVTDCETAYYIIRGEYPFHRWLHTYLGATAVALFCVIAGRPLCQLAMRLWLAWRHAPFKRFLPTTARISLCAAMTAAFIGTYSHVLLDSIMHSDVRPLRPFSDANPLLGLIGWSALHTLCIFLGAFGLWWVSNARRY
jgi:hypothetical protein